MHILWPRSRYASSPPVRVLVWWPIAYLLLVLSSYFGAALFGAFHWAPTAGFNLSMLIAGLTLGVLYFVESDI